MTNDPQLNEHILNAIVKIIDTISDSEADFLASTLQRGKRQDVTTALATA